MYVCMYVCMYIYISIYIYIYVSVFSYPYGCTLTAASRYNVNVTFISHNFFIANLQVSTFDSRLNFTRRAPFRG